MTLHKVKKEWRIAIILSALIKLTTMVWSMFAAFYFVFDLINNSLNSFIQSVIFTVLVLLSIEFLTAVFLEKTFKFFYRKRFSIALPSFIVVIILFSLSFISSTEGLSKRQADKKDNTTEITAYDKFQKDSIINLFKEVKIEYQKQMEIIKSNPEGWLDGKRCILLDWQLKAIENYQTKIDDLRKDEKHEIAVIDRKTKEKILINQNLQKSTAKKYYKVMMVVMIIQLFVTALLIFFLHLIRIEEQPDAVIQESLDYIQHNIEESAQAVMYNSIATAMNKFNNMANIIFATYENKDFSNKENSAEKKEKTVEKQIGFVQAKPNKKTITEPVQNNEKNGSVSEQKTTEPLGYPSGSEEKTVEKQTGFVQAKSDKKTTAEPVQNNEKNGSVSEQKTTEPLGYPKGSVVLKKDVDFLNRHKKIVVEILKLEPMPVEFIRNKHVRIVQNNTPKDIQKSRSTIQRVFLTMQGVGFKNFDEVGNIKIEILNKNQ